MLKCIEFLILGKKIGFDQNDINSLRKNIVLTCTTDNYKCNLILFWQKIVLTCTTDNYKCNLILVYKLCFI